MKEFRPRPERFKRHSVMISAIFCLTLLFFLIQTASAQEDDGKVKFLKSLSMEELLQTEVTSVSKKAEHLFDTSAAVFVISQEDIRRSGVRSIPEALRMAPGLQVAQIDANK